jgi:hypothetical protein
LGENVEFRRDSGRENKVIRDAKCIVGVLTGQIRPYYRNLPLETPISYLLPKFALKKDLQKE